MKFNFLNICMLSLILVACNSPKEKGVTITGKITNPMNEMVAFENSDSTYNTELNEQGMFEVFIPLDSASYLNFSHGVESTAMYILPGDHITVGLNPEEFDESVSYQGSPASSFLAKKYLLDEMGDFWGESFYLSSADEYKALLQDFKTTLMADLNNIKSEVFKALEIAEMEEAIEEYSDEQEKFTENPLDVRTYKYEAISISEKYNFYAALDTTDLETFSLMLDDYQQQHKSALDNVVDQEFVTEATEKVGKTVKTWKGRKVATDNVPKAGALATDFAYEDMEGNEVSLSSLKGNLVYVDVWATWCGPCKAEIPSLQKLEADYHNQNITFLSVSVDIEKEDWEKMVTDMDLGGTQIWADGWSEITEDYAIFGIPRFMLFSADGKVITTDAPRPSSAEIRDLLDANI
jgi:thiol-disulfide isomerase/thioredoxin